MIFDRTEFEGTVGTGEQTYPVAFSAQAGTDGRLQIDLQPTPTQVTLDLQDTMGRPGSTSERVSLVGKTRSGITFSSGDIDIHGVSLGTNGNGIFVSALCATISFPEVKQPPHAAMRLWLRGFRSNRNPVVETILGKLAVRGSAKSVPHDEVSGCIIIQADEAMDLSGWIGRADNFLSFMHRGLSFGQGHRLQSPMLEASIDGRRELTFYAGQAFAPGLPAVHCLTQEHLITALVRRYEHGSPFQEVLWTAVGWLQSDTMFDESRFLTSMTALEAIVENVIPLTLTTIVDRSDFVPVRDELLQAVDQSSLTSTAKEILCGKIKGLNSRSLSQKLGILRDHYSLSADTFDSASIVALVKLRNDIVHTGMSVRTTEIWSKIVFIRELVSQIMFHELGYVGPYESYVPEYRTGFFEQRAIKVEPVADR